MRIVASVLEVVVNEGDQGRHDRGAAGVGRWESVLAESCRNGGKVAVSLVMSFQAGDLIAVISASR